MFVIGTAFCHVGFPFAADGTGQLFLEGLPDLGHHGGGLLLAHEVGLGHQHVDGLRIGHGVADVGAHEAVDLQGLEDGRILADGALCHEFGADVVGGVDLFVFRLGSQGQGQQQAAAQKPFFHVSS